MSDQTRVLLAACDCLSVDLSRLKLALVPGQEAEDVSILLRDMEGCNNDVKLAARKVSTLYAANDTYTPSPNSGAWTGGGRVFL